jgi:hypothetical protein
MFTAAKLIMQYFGATDGEIKGLSTVDRQQLGSAIARSLGVEPASLRFKFVEY